MGRFWISPTCRSQLFVVFLLVSLSDLEHDLVNPIDMCKKCNLFALPDMLIQLTITAFMLVSGQWLALLLNLPLLAFHVYQFQNRRHMLDQTRVFQQMGQLQRIGFVKLGFFMLMFFLYLYKLVFTLVRAIG